MGQKIHPIGFRLSVNKNWSSRWYANSKTFATMLNEDLKVRDYLKKRLSHASVGKVVIERPAKDARITIHSARPGVVIGKKGEDIEMLKADQPVAPPAPTADEVLAAKKVKKATPKPALSAPEAKPEPITAAKAASDTGSSAAPQAKPRAARPHPVVAKKAVSDAKGKAEGKSEAKPKTAVKKSRKPKA